MSSARVRRAPHPPRSRLLSPGAPLAPKNLDLVLRCLAAAPAGSATASAELDISGARAESFPAVDTFIRSLGLANRVHWLGLVERTQMPQLMAGAAVLLYPSFYEGFGLPPLEAMAVGAPVIASKTPPLPPGPEDPATPIHPHRARGFPPAL